MLCIVLNTIARVHTSSAYNKFFFLELPSSSSSSYFPFLISIHSCICLLPPFFSYTSINIHTNTHVYGHERRKKKSSIKLWNSGSWVCYVVVKSRTETDLYHTTNDLYQMNKWYWHAYELIHEWVDMLLFGLCTTAFATCHLIQM